MQTFLPYPSFPLSAHVLDARRLGKQRVEGVQILRALAGHGKNSSWQFHPAVGMWRRHERSLMRYVHAVMVEWVRRGYTQNIASPQTPEGKEMYQLPDSWYNRPIVHPVWLGHERFHAAHRAALLHKDPDWYAQFAWTEPPVLDYWWPGRIPVAGEYLVDSLSREAVLVIQMHKDYAECINEHTQAVHAIPREQIIMRKWERAQRRNV